MPPTNIAFIDTNGNICINGDFFNKYIKKFRGKLLIYYVILILDSLRLTRKEIREKLGIDGTTEWRYRKILRREGLL